MGPVGHGRSSLSPSTPVVLFDFQRCDLVNDQLQSATSMLELGLGSSVGELGSYGIDDSGVMTWFTRKALQNVAIPSSLRAVACGLLR
jgi:hypothetical protein